MVIADSFMLQVPFSKWVCCGLPLEDSTGIRRVQ